jgi:hypothetical protein
MTISKKGKKGQTFICLFFIVFPFHFSLTFVSPPLITSISTRLVNLTLSYSVFIVIFLSNKIHGS